MLDASRKIFLLPGQLTIARNHEEITTILGSCVSIVLHSPTAHISAVNHAQQPAKGGGISCRETCPHPCGKAEIPDHKYVTCSFDFIWERLMALGISKGELQVGLYGGATSDAMAGNPYGVSQSNIAAAEAVLASRGLRIHHRDVGGRHARKLRHDSSSGITIING
ncbi:MAG: chemotaxis protein CheD [Deltaproteobacteria bacterium]|nr:chemotaxis protein CheD [Deltaproteobacteria bacterium]